MDELRSVLQRLKADLKSRSIKDLLKKFLLLAAMILLIDIMYLASLAPTMFSIRNGEVPESVFIKTYKEKRDKNPILPELRWTPSKSWLPKFHKMPFLIAEDAKFYSHSGIDFSAIWNAMVINFRLKRILVGASTITQQTVKNLFLSPRRSFVRKWHELILTYMIEIICTKDQILHTYLNVAEFGTGLFGIESASRHYYGKAANTLTLWETVGLAASLPSPKKNNPGSGTEFFTERQKKIYHLIEAYYSHLYPETFRATPESDEPIPTLNDIEDYVEGPAQDNDDDSELTSGDEDNKFHSEEENTSDSSRVDSQNRTSAVEGEKPESALPDGDLKVSPIENED